MESKRDLLIFVPTYNEAENVEVLFREIYKLQLGTWEMLFLDDNSPDGTGKIIDRLVAGNPNVHAIHRSGKQGIGSAHQVGIRWAYEQGFHSLLTMDCDFTHPPQKIPEFLRFRNEYDIVVGSRFQQKNSLPTWTLLRKTLTHVGHLLTTNALGMPFDATGAYRLYRLDRIPVGIFDLVDSPGYSFFFESLYVLWLNGFQVKEVPLELPARTYGHSKMTWKDAANSTRVLCRLFLKTRLQRKKLTYSPAATTTTTATTDR